MTIVTAPFTCQPNFASDRTLSAQQISFSFGETKLNPVLAIVLLRNVVVVIVVGDGDGDGGVFISCVFFLFKLIGK